MVPEALLCICFLAFNLCVSKDIKCFAAYVIRHTSHVTRHTSHVTRHCRLSSFLAAAEGWPTASRTTLLSLYSVVWCDCGGGGGNMMFIKMQVPLMCTGLVDTFDSLHSVCVLQVCVCLSVFLSVADGGTVLRVRHIVVWIEVLPQPHVTRGVCCR